MVGRLRSLAIKCLALVLWLGVFVFQKVVRRNFAWSMPLKEFTLRLARVTIRGQRPAVDQLIGRCTEISLIAPSFKATHWAWHVGLCCFEGSFAGVFAFAWLGQASDWPSCQAIRMSSMHRRRLWARPACMSYALRSSLLGGLVSIFSLRHYRAFQCGSGLGASAREASDSPLQWQSCGWADSLHDSSGHQVYAWWSAARGAFCECVTPLVKLLCLCGWSFSSIELVGGSMTCRSFGINWPSTS